jgi:hypothetical protein
VIQPIAIFSVPRSGTSWLGQIFNSSPHVIYRFQPLFSFAFKDFLSDHSSSTEIMDFYEKLKDTQDSFVLQTKTVGGSAGFSFSKERATHLVWKEVRYLHVIENLLHNSDTRIIGLARHPCGVINSWLRAPREFNKEWDPETEWRLADKKNQGRIEEYNGYEKWKACMRLYIALVERYKDKFIITRYEDLSVDPLREVARLFNFAGLDFTKQTSDFIKLSTSVMSNDPYGVMRKEQDAYAWRTQLNTVVASQILSDPEFIQLNAYFGWSI